MAPPTSTLPGRWPTDPSPSDGAEFRPQNPLHPQTLLSFLPSAIGNSPRSCYYLIYLSSPLPQRKRKRSKKKELSSMLQEQATTTTSSLPSSSERSSSSGHQIYDREEGMESDEDARRVPEFGQDEQDQPGGGDSSASGLGGGHRGCEEEEEEEEENRAVAQSSSSVAGGQRRRGKSPADKEHKRLKRLLRNRVSAQQARERKKAYVNDLEAKVKELEGRNSELEEGVSTLQNENNMLRQILKNTTGSRRGPGE